MSSSKYELCSPLQLASPPSLPLSPPRATATLTRAEERDDSGSSVDQSSSSSSRSEGSQGKWHVQSFPSSTSSCETANIPAWLGGWLDGDWEEATGPSPIHVLLPWHPVDVLQASLLPSIHPSTGGPSRMDRQVQGRLSAKRQYG